MDVAPQCLELAAALPLPWAGGRGLGAMLGGSGPGPGALFCPWTGLVSLLELCSWGYGRKLWDGVVDDSIQNGIYPVNSG